MRLTDKLFAQHLGFMFKKHWEYKKHRLAIDTGALAALAGKFNVKNPTDVLSPPIQNPVLEEISTDLRDEKTVYLFNDSNVLLGGLAQAQALTKTVVINNLPKNLNDSLGKLQLPSSVDKQVQKSIMASHIYDAEQEKLDDIIKDEKRPAFNFPRQFGITRIRRCKLLTNKLIFEVEKLANPVLTAKRKILPNVTFSVILDKYKQKLLMNLTSDQIILAEKPLQSYSVTKDGEIPDLYPMKSTISIPQYEISVLNDHMPISPLSFSRYSSPHTLWIYFSPFETRNLFETPVTATQIQSRSLLKGFAAAAVKAKLLYGNDIKDLPNPIVVQTVQTDGKSFHFGVFQLNTLNLNGIDGVKNVLYHIDNIDLFNLCEYRTGKPVLEGYNKDVIRLINSFYNNQ